EAASGSFESGRGGADQGTSHAGLLWYLASGNQNHNTRRPFSPTTSTAPIRQGDTLPLRPVCKLDSEDESHRTPDTYIDTGIQSPQISAEAKEIDSIRCIHVSGLSAMPQVIVNLSAGAVREILSLFLRPPW